MKAVFEKVMPPKTGLAGEVKTGQIFRVTDLEGLFDDFPRGPERDPLPIRKAAALQHAHPLAEARNELHGRARLSDAGRTQQDEADGGIPVDRIPKCPRE